jgi:hypothetical protein
VVVDSVHVIFAILFEVFNSKSVHCSSNSQQREMRAIRSRAIRTKNQNCH